MRTRSEWFLGARGGSLELHPDHMRQSTSPGCNQSSTLPSTATIGTYNNAKNDLNATTPLLVVAKSSPLTITCNHNNDNNLGEFARSDSLDRVYVASSSTHASRMMRRRGRGATIGATMGVSSTTNRMINLHHPPPHQIHHHTHHHQHLVHPSSSNSRHTSQNVARQNSALMIFFTVLDFIF